jgi:hypothetical protein
LLCAVWGGRISGVPAPAAAARFCAATAVAAIAGFAIVAGLAAGGVAGTAGTLGEGTRKDMDILPQYFLKYYSKIRYLSII